MMPPPAHVIFYRKLGGFYIVHLIESLVMNKFLVDFAVLKF